MQRKTLKTYDYKVLLAELETKVMYRKTGWFTSKTKAKEYFTIPGFNKCLAVSMYYDEIEQAEERFHAKGYKYYYEVDQ